MSDLTLKIGYDISVYLGDVLVVNNPSLFWGVLRKPRSLHGVNRPRVLGFVGDQSVFTYGLVKVAIRKSTRCPDINQLYEVYVIWNTMASKN